MIVKIKQKIKDLDPIDFSLQLSIFFIVIHFSNSISKSPILFIPIIITGAVGLLFHETRLSLIFWGIQTVFYFSWVVFNWQLIDNHRFLWGYWLLSILVACFSKFKVISLRISAKYLIALCMTFAATQKILSSNYLTGDFFIFKLITDSRFSFIGKFIDFNLPKLIYNNNLDLEQLRLNAETMVLDLGPKTLSYISFGLTWYALLIEFIIAILFFLPRKKFYYWQHCSLLIFSTLYFLIPVKGFAYTLLTLGFVLIRKNDIQIKTAYLLFYLYIFGLASFFKDLIF